ncbi:MAG: hypothetical protein MUF54_02370 [Polyangiaceae bacterium]|jgi:hypothetical protein|nr:hypothetical protein [Polyangiaceae bacterium]
MRDPSTVRRAEPSTEVPDLDMEALIDSVRHLVNGWCSKSGAARTVSRATFHQLDRPNGFPSKSPRPEIVLAADVAVELGPPALPSCALLLTTGNASVLSPGRVTVVGPDLQQVAPGARLPFAQVIALAVAPGARPDPFSLENTQYLTHRLPGYMARSIPGRLWIRVSRCAHASGLTLLTVGRLLLHTYLAKFPELVAGEVLFVTSSSDDVQAFAPLALEAQVVAGLHRRLALSPEGDLSCTELTCDACHEKPVCDGLRDMLRQRGTKR